MRNAVLALVAFGLMVSGLAVPVVAAGPPSPPTPNYGNPPTYQVSSSFTSSTPTIDGYLSPHSGFSDGGSTHWPFTATNEWSNAAKFGMFSYKNGDGTEPPWSTIDNAMYFPSKNTWAKLTIEASGPSAPTSPPWAPSWLFIMNDGSNLYLLGMINPANKQCLECPAGSGPSDMMDFSLQATNGTVESYYWNYNQPGNPQIQGGVVAVDCPKAVTNGFIEGTCPSPTVYEVSIPLSNLGCTILPCTVGLYVQDHASPHGNTCTSAKPPAVAVCIPQLYTSPNPSTSVGVNTLISDKATMYFPSTTGTTAWGSIEFNLFAGSCSSLEGATATALYSDTVAVSSSNNGATLGYNSGTYSTSSLSVGDYSWLVRYVPPATGAVYPATPFQSSNNGLVGVEVNNIWYFCEPLSLIPQVPTSITTQVSLSSFELSSPPSQSVTDTATFINANSPTGNLVFTVYSDSACTTQVFTSTNAITGPSVTSDPFTPTAVGTYFWKVSYAGDPNNSPYTSPCGAAAAFSEAVIVTSPPSTTTSTTTKTTVITTVTTVTSDTTTTIITTVSTCTLPPSGVPEFPGAQVGSVALLAVSLLALLLIRRLEHPGSVPAGSPPGRV